MDDVVGVGDGDGDGGGGGDWGDSSNSIAIINSWCDISLPNLDYRHFQPGNTSNLQYVFPLLLCFF